MLRPQVVIIIALNTFMAGIQWHMAGRLGALMSFGTDKGRHKFIKQMVNIRQRRHTQAHGGYFCHLLRSSAFVSGGKLPTGICFELNVWCKSRFGVSKWRLSGRTCLLAPVKGARFDKCCNERLSVGLPLT